MWSFDTSNANYQSLALGSYKDIEVKYIVSDGQATGNGSFTIHLAGVNDAASITGNSTGIVNGNAEVSVAKGSLQVVDVDSGENVFNGSGIVTTTTSHGQFAFDFATGSWAYTPNQVAATSGDAHIYQDQSNVLTSKDGTASTQLSANIYVAGANTNLVLDGTASLDLSALHALDSNIKVDKVDMTSAGVNNLILDVASVLDMTTAIPGKLMVDGDASDHVYLTQLWAHNSATSTVNGQSYDVYTLGGAEVWINHDVNQHNPL